MRGEDMAEQEKYLFRAEKICKSFGTVHALKEFDITIKAGEIRGLVGENGSGKSTFSSIPLFIILLKLSLNSALLIVPISFGNSLKGVSK